MSDILNHSSEQPGRHSIERDCTESVSNESPRLLQAMNEYMTAVDAGLRPNRRELLARYPEIATELSACLRGAAFLTSAAAQLNGESSRSNDKTAMDVGFSTAEPLGDFRLIREIGRGGMGVVYEALQLSLGRRVALKVLPFANALDSRHLQRFRNEAQAAAQLHHTNIVPIYAVGCERSVHFYAMQLIDGQSLEEIIKELKTLRSGASLQDVIERRSKATGSSSPNSDRTQILRQESAAHRSGGAQSSAGSLLSAPLSAPGQSSSPSLSSLHSVKASAYYRTIAKLALQAAEALEYAHQLGIVHRDIKPANLLLDTRGVLWIADFGLAQLYASSNLTQTGDILGTLRYMSPEQASGRTAILDQRTDVYSLGVTLYELLTLERALTGQSREELLYQLGSVEPLSLRIHDHAIPVELETIVCKAISKDAVDRYLTAAELAADLKRFLEDLPIIAKPPSLFDRAVKWTRRHKSLTRSGLAILILGSIALLLSNVLISAEQSRTKAALISARREEVIAKSQRELASANFQQAREAVDFFTEYVSQDLPNSPQLDAPRREMLEESLAYYQNFLNEHTNEPSTNAELKAARANINRIVTSLVTGEQMSRLLIFNRLIKERSVQEDLAMTGDQRMRARSLRFKFPPPPGADPSAKHLQPGFGDAIPAYQKQLSALLTESQIHRLEQISRQLRGVWALIDADVSAALKLTPEESRQIRRIRVAAKGRENDPQELHAVLGEQPSMTQTLAIFTPIQRRTWNELIGDPFKGNLTMPGQPSDPPSYP